MELARQGAEVVHLVFDAHGARTMPDAPAGGRTGVRTRAMRATCCARSTRALVKAGVRDEITLIASGGIALAEHMAKAIICGADLVAIDIPLAPGPGMPAVRRMPARRTLSRSPWRRSSRILPSTAS